MTDRLTAAAAVLFAFGAVLLLFARQYFRVPGAGRPEGAGGLSRKGIVSLRAPGPKLARLGWALMVVGLMVLIPYWISGLFFD